MSVLVVDAMGTAAAWGAFEADGITASTELQLADETDVVRFGSGTSGRVTATTLAFDHRLTRALPDVDLSGFDELRLATRGQPTATGEPGSPFYLELRLGSAALPIEDPANLWHRLLPVSGKWSTVPLGLFDLPPAARSAVDELQLRCVDAARTFRVFVDDILAVRHEMVADVDAALTARCTGLLLGGALVPAEVRLGTEALEVPSIDIRHRSVRFAHERSGSAELARDFTGQGHRIMPAGDAYDLLYSFSARAGDRADEATILEFLLDRLPPQGELPVAGIPRPIDLVWPPYDIDPPVIPELWYRIGTRAAPPSLPAEQVTEVSLATFQKEPA